MNQFDPNLPRQNPADPDLIVGDVTAVIVREPGNLQPYDVGNSVLSPSKPFQVVVRWKVTGLLGPLWLAALGGKWNVQVYAESMGAGPEIRLASNNNIPAVPTQQNYEATLDVPAGILPEGNPGSSISGIYKLVVSVFLNSNLPAPGYDMIGFSEGPYIQIENPN
ncbi:hypothetical protein [Kribbella sindirgiensis]|uniref:Uncharacterized protein n=1 Tax=Kribbella sindirgiensis TaxID=1124744 RepID=A0A4R0I4V5_9ACTN|nr:hypothetical protein [Kribbella sindirgiensis]TCC21658.1 hypothetical protein E0H50_35880 [Kribbella sindirgiensis]